MTAAGLFLITVSACLWLPSLLDRIPRPRPDSDDEGCDSSNCPCSDCAIFAVVEQARRDVDEAADFREWSKEMGA